MVERSQRLRGQLVEMLRARGHVQSPQVAAAFLAVPRELFVPGVSPEVAYRPSDAIEVKRLDGVRVSSASAPDVMAIMLEQLAVAPGQRVLEVGAGTGYNAALLAHLVGETGQVISLDIDEDLVLGAREHLAALGLERVTVVQRDGALGYAEAAPFDRIMLTVASQDVAPAWREQLAAGGRLVLPLSLDGPQRSIAFERSGDCLASVAVTNCAFLPLRGELGFGSARLMFGQGDSLSLGLRGDRLPALQPRALERQLRAPARLLATGVAASTWQARGGLLLWLMAHEPRVFTILGQPGAHFLPDMLGTPGHVRGTVCLVDAAGVACLSWLDEAAQAGELAVRQAEGGSAAAAERLLELVRAWQAAGQPDDRELRIRVYAREQAVEPGPDEFVLDQRWSRIVLSWA